LISVLQILAQRRCEVLAEVLQRCLAQEKLLLESTVSDVNAIFSLFFTSSTIGDAAVHLSPSPCQKAVHFFLLEQLGQRSVSLKKTTIIFCTHHPQ